MENKICLVENLDKQNLVSVMMVIKTGMVRNCASEAKKRILARAKSKREKNSKAFECRRGQAGYSILFFNKP
ncbi:MAG: hypothetical protein HFE94_04765 [Acutalibacter sp.]|nr:hypothetical protein [Acutalibacter sp.]